MKKIKPPWAVLGLILLGALYFTWRVAAGAPDPADQPAGAAASAAPALEPSGSVSLPPFPVEESGSGGGITRMTLLQTIIPTRPRIDVITYTVQPGDNLFVIGDRFNLKPETILWGNYEVLRDNPQFLKPDQVLIILPVDGTYYQWEQGDTLQEIADFFEVTVADIVNFPGNRFDEVGPDGQAGALGVGDWVIVPGGVRELRDWGPPAISRTNPASAAYYGSGSCGAIYEGAIGTGTFIWPTPTKTLSGYDYRPGFHNGIDIGGPEGNPVWAVDSGVVVYAGWSEYGFGNLIVLDHGNGWQSAYAHLSVVGVVCGQSVALGTVIGNVGNTGNSTGPHLHFELRSEIFGKVNPWDYLIP
jgi:murein DD-endopeptidase MepM/ murein hydrolase activator NlpD